ncbi:MAG TPA: hypothetical protein VF874_11420 [Mycobacterium sp.]
MPGAQRAAVAPPVEDLAHPLRRHVDRGIAEHELRQVQPVEHTQQMEAVEASDQVGDRDQERAHRGLGRCHPCGQERFRAGAAQARPVIGLPAPVAATGLGAVLQHEPGRVRAGAAIARVGRVVQHRTCVVERLGQQSQPVPQHISLGCAAGAAAAQPHRAELEQRVQFQLRQLRAPVVAVGAQPERERSPVRLRHGGATNDGGGHRCSPAPTVAVAVSMPIR